MTSRKPNLAERKTPLEEILHRVRRMETRQVTDMRARGIDTPAQLPYFAGRIDTRAMVDLPTTRCSLQDILDAVPRHVVVATIVLRVNGEAVGMLTLPAIHG